jgi:hypothetical protein
MMGYSRDTAKDMMYDIVAASYDDNEWNEALATQSVYRWELL